MAIPQGRTVHIDGDCALCNGFARFIMRRDSRRLFEFVPGNRSSTVMVVEDGCTYTRSTAVLRVLAGLGFPWSWLAGLGAVIPVSLRDAVYDWVARRRRRIGCRLE